MGSCPIILLLVRHAAGSWISVVPKGITDDQESNVGIPCTTQDFITGGLDHFTVCDDNGAAIEGLLLVIQRSVSFFSYLVTSSRKGREGKGREGKEQERTSFALSTSRTLVYASRYTLSACFTICKPLRVMSVSSARPRPTRYSILDGCWSICMTTGFVIRLSESPEVHEPINTTIEICRGFADN
jgi:hypothetical protein